MRQTTAARVTGLSDAKDLSFEPDDGLRREPHDGVIHVGLRRIYVPDLTVVHRDTPYHDFAHDPGGSSTWSSGAASGARSPRRGRSSSA